jgi:hypothetical protein
MPAQPSVRQQKFFAKALLTLSALALLSWLPASAQNAQPLQNPNAVTNQLYQTQQTPAPPPPGSPGSPPPVTPGDTSTNPPVATGTADKTPGTNFPTGVGQTDTTVRIFVNEGGRGLREVQTIRPTTLTSQELSQVQGVLGTSLTTGEPVIDVTVTKAQMEQLNQILAPWPQYDMNGNRKKINSDSPAQGYPKETPNYEFKGPLPTVKTFSRYLVLLGVVCSTVFMALAATKVVMGHRDAGACVVGAASGLMLLLCAYTIWKIVQMNTFNDNTSGPAQIQQDSNQGIVNDGNLTAPNVPITPTAPNTPQRPGIPVIPLSGN